MMNSVDTSRPTSTHTLAPSLEAPRSPAWSGGEPLPERLRRIMERLSGYDLGDVRVHVASPWPARIGARAFALGSDIHLSPGAEDALGHEVWHVVQQKQGRVRATGAVTFADPRLGETALNDEEALEREADTMGLVARNLLQLREDRWTWRRLRFATIDHPVLQRNVTIGNQVYATDKGDDFLKDVTTQLAQTANTVKDLPGITKDLLAEGLSFADWPAALREVYIRNVGYQAERVMFNLMVQHQDKYKKAQDAIKSFADEADKTWAQEIKLESSQRKTYTDEQQVFRAKAAFADDALEKADVIVWGPASFTDNPSLVYRPMFQWMIGGTAREPRKMNCWEAVLYSLVKANLVPASYIALANTPERAQHGDYAEDPMYMGTFPTRLQAGLMTAMDYFFWARDTDKYPCYIQSASPVSFQNRKIPTTRCAWIPPDWTIPRGRVLLFGMGDHVALSTGRMRQIESADAQAHFKTEEGHGMLELDASTGTIRETTIEDLYADRPGYLRGIVVAPFPIFSEAYVKSFTVPGQLDPDQEKQVSTLRSQIEQEYQKIYAQKVEEVKNTHKESITTHESRLSTLKSELTGLTDPEAVKSKENAIYLETTVLNKAQAMEYRDLRAVEREKDEEIEAQLTKLVKEALEIKRYPPKPVRVSLNVKAGIDPYGKLVTFRAPTPKSPVEM